MGAHDPRRGAPRTAAAVGARIPRRRAELPREVPVRGEVLNGGLNEVLKGVLNGEVLNCRVKSLRGAARSAARSLPENGARHFVRAPKHQPGRGWPHRNDGLSSVSGGRYSPTSRRVHHAGGAAPSC